MSSIDKPTYTYYADRKKLIVLEPDFFSSDDYLKFPDAEVLDSYRCGLNNLPDTIGSFKNLKVLNLNGNYLSEIPESIGELTKLEELNLFQNRLRFLPESIGNLEHLEKLILSYNKLRILPDTIGNLRSLQLLDVSNNRLKAIPRSIINIPSLKKVNIDANKDLTYWMHTPDAYVLVKLNDKGVEVTITDGNLPSDYREDFEDEDNFEYFIAHEYTYPEDLNREILDDIRKRRFRGEENPYKRPRSFILQPSDSMEIECPRCHARLEPFVPGMYNCPKCPYIIKTYERYG